MEKLKIFKSSKETKLPFDIMIDSHFENYSIRYKNGSLESIEIETVVNLLVLLELKEIGKQLKKK